MRHHTRIPAAMTVLGCSRHGLQLPIFAPSTPPAAATLGQLYTQAAQTLEASQPQTGHAHARRNHHGRRFRHSRRQHPLTQLAPPDSATRRLSFGT